MPTVRDQAICIRHWDWSETSQTVSVFARELGVVRAVAKGARREGSPFSGGLELMARGEIVAIVKANERSPDSMATLCAWDLQETFPAARRSLNAFHAGMYMLDLVHHAVRDADPHPGLFDALLESLRRLDPPAHVETALAWFQWQTLAHSGLAPELDVHVETRRPLRSATVLGFSPSGGGLVDLNDNGPTTARSSGERDPSTVWRVRAETIESLRRIAGAGELPPEPLPPVAAARANRLLAWYIRSVLGHWPHAVHTAFPGIAGVEP